MCASRIKVICASINGNNMKYSYNWLQSHIEDPLPLVEDLKEIIIFHAFEVEEIEVLPTDTVFDIKVLPDRAGDCLSHYGMAREIAGLLSLNLKTAEYSLPQADFSVPIDVQAPECIRYSAIRIEGIKVGPSPAWLVKKLASVGQRSINNIVDATNFILLDTGQPTHAFDASKVTGSIVVRKASAGETITTLNGEAKILKEDMMVIADTVKALAIAGVKGGLAAEVTDTTTSIIVEIANFDAVSVRKTSRSLGLITDASKRFENNLAPFLVESAGAQLVTLMQTLAGGTVTSMGEHYPYRQMERAISFTLGDIQRVLGNTVTDSAMVKVLDRYGYTYEARDHHYTLAIPLWRQDIIGAHDMAEEIGRVIGYDIIPAQPLPFTPAMVRNEDYEKIRAIKLYLAQQGYREVMTYSFRKKGELTIAYGPKDKSALRADLADALKESYELNRLNASLLGITEIKLFEVGTVFPEGKEIIHVGMADKNGVTEKSVEDFYTEHKTEIDALDIPTIAQETLYNRGKALFKPWSPYPFITRDIAVWVAENDAAILNTIVENFAAQQCACPPVLFDTFTKEGRVSVAYRLVFQSMEKTLTIAETEKQFQILVQAITGHVGMTIR
jgi:phenylalanyl-tRNA synthetase beta subunit